MELDWSRCIICQMKATEPFKCPANCPAADTQCVEETYRKFLENVMEFREIDSMPCSVPFGIEHLTPSYVNGASWHKSCYLNVNTTKLQRARKRSMERDGNAVPPAVERPKRQCIGSDVCVFCLQDGGLHNSSTFDADHKVRKMVTELEDRILMSRMASGDLIAIEAKYL